NVELFMYSSFISNACDNMPNGIAYQISGRGVNFSGNGAENVKKILKATSFRGFVLSGFYSWQNGSDDPNNPTDYLFEFVTGKNATISGVEIALRANTTKYINYKLGLTSSNYG